MYYNFLLHTEHHFINLFYFQLDILQIIFQMTDTSFL